MTTLCGLLLALATILTLPFAPGIGSVDALTGSDRAGAGFQLVAFTFPRWLALAFVLGVLLSRGDFRWVAHTRGVQVCVVLGLHLLLGILSVTLLSLAAKDGAPESGRLPFSLPLTVSFVLPLLVGAYCALRLFDLAGTLGSALPTRLLAGVAAAGALGVIALIAQIRRDLQESNTARTQAAEAEKEKRRSEETTFAALKPDAPLAAWLPYTVYGTPEAMQTQALTSIASRPALEEEVASELRGGTSQQKETVLRAIGLLKPSPPAALANVVLPTADDLARFIIATANTVPPTQFERDAEAHRLSMALVEALFGLRKAGVDVDAALTAIRDAARERASANAQDIVRVYEYHLSHATAAR